ncbi:hypothetical protein TNCV_2987221 [Trichonephila clavipes]|nr:hypothetical protein TNCV_2987221 [Trichonephila clavipes]
MKHNFEKYLVHRFSAVLLHRHLQLQISKKLLISYSSDFKWPKKKKSKRSRSEERGGQATCPTRRIHLLGYIAWKWSWTAIEKCFGAPSCMNHRFRCALAGTLCSNSGRREKFAYAQISSTLPRHPKSQHPSVSSFSYYCNFHRLIVICDPMFYNDLSSLYSLLSVL